MNDEPRVLILVENEPVPGDRRVWLECLALREAGYGVSVICPAGNREPLYEEREGVRLHRYPPPPDGGGAIDFALEFAYSWVRTARLLRRVLRDERIDVVQACNPPDTAFPFAYLTRRPFVFDQHDLSPEIYTSRFGRDRGPLLRALRLLERETYRAADHVIVTNAWYREVALIRGRKRPEDVTVVRNGPELDTMRKGRPHPELKRGRRHLCCFLGVMEPHDGVDLAIRAAHHLVGVEGRQDCHFAFLGAGESLPSLRQLVADLGLDDVATFTGWADDDMIDAYLSTADIGLQPDPKDPRTDISTATKTIEYMAYELPVVAFDLRETRASAQEAATYARPNDPVAYAEAIAALLDDPDRRAKMGRIGRERVENGLSWDHQRVEYVQVFDRVLADPGTHPQRKRPGPIRRAGRRDADGGDSRLAVRFDVSPCDDEWDNFVEDAPGCDHLQTSLWAQVKAVHGWSAGRVKVYSDGTLLGGCQLLIRRAARVSGVAYVPRGPLVPADRPDVLRTVLDGVERFVRRQRLLYLKLQPPVDRWDLGDELAARGYTESGLAPSAQATILVDLRKDLEDILRGMPGSTRYSVRRGSKRGLTTRLGDAEDLDTFYERVSATARRQGFEPYTRDYYERMWTAFARRGKAALVLSEHEGLTLSAQITIGYGDTAVAKMRGWNGEGAKLGPNEAVDWRTIEWAKEQGYQWFDLGGIDVEVANALRTDPETRTTMRTEGGTGYKLKFGGDATVFPAAWDRTSRPISAALRWMEDRDSVEKVVKRLLGRRPAR